MEVLLFSSDNSKSEHSTPAHVRLLLVFLIILVLVLSNHIYSFAGYFLIALILWFKSPLGLKTGFKRMLLVDSVVLLTILPLPFTVVDGQVLEWGVFSLSTVGILKAQEVFIKACVSIMLMMSQCSGMSAIELSRALSRLKVPLKFILILQFSIRYISVMEQELTSLKVAMRARGLGNGPLLHTWRSYGYLFGMLLVRALARGDRIWLAMKCRGYQGVFPVASGPQNENNFHLQSGFYLFLSVLIFILDISNFWSNNIYF